MKYTLAIFAVVCIFISQVCAETFSFDFVVDFNNTGDAAFLENLDLAQIGDNLTLELELESDLNFTSGTAQSTPFFNPQNSSATIKRGQEILFENTSNNFFTFRIDDPGALDNGLNIVNQLSFSSGVFPAGTDQNIEFVLQSEGVTFNDGISVFDNLNLFANNNVNDRRAVLFNVFRSNLPEVSGFALGELPEQNPQAAIPEPSTYIALLLGLISLGMVRKRK